MPHALPTILGYLVCLSTHAYIKPKDHQIIGAPHGATILDKIMKNEAADQKIYCGLIAWVSYVDRFQTWM